jgi:hypothetical protein
LLNYNAKKSQKRTGACFCVSLEIAPTSKKRIILRSAYRSAFHASCAAQHCAFPASPGDDVNTGLLTDTGPVFGKTQSAYRDITVSVTNDPGGRLIEFALRYNF